MVGTSFQKTNYQIIFNWDFLQTIRLLTYWKRCNYNKFISVKFTTRKTSHYEIYRPHPLVPIPHVNHSRLVLARGREQGGGRSPTNLTIETGAGQGTLPTWPGGWGQAPVMKTLPSVTLRAWSLNIAVTNNNNNIHFQPQRNQTI